MSIKRNPQLRKLITSVLEKLSFPNDYISFDKLSKVIAKAYPQISNTTELITPELVVEELIGLLSDFFSYGKYCEAKQSSELSLDIDQIKKGTEVEMEHTSCWMIAERIAKDHLTESNDYYIELEKMEQKLEKEPKKLNEIKEIIKGNIDPDCGCVKG